MLSESKNKQETAELGKRSSAIFGDAEDLSGEALFQHIVSRMANVLPWFGGIVFLVSLSRAWQSGWHPLFDVQIAFILIVFLVFALQKRLPPQWTAIALITALHFVGMLSLISYGIVGSGGAIIWVGVCIFCGTIYGRHLGFVVIGLTSFSFILVAAGSFAGLWPVFPNGVEQYVSSLTSWANVGVDITVVPIVVVLCISAIQERLRAAVKMNRADNIFINSVLNSQHDLFLVFDPDTGKSLSWNNAFREFTGIPDQEIERRRMPDDWLESSDISIEGAMNAISRLHSGQEQYLEMQLKNYAGENVPVEFHAAIVDLPDQRKVIVAIGRDLRERRAAEQALRESERHFRMISETMPAVVWTVNHAGKLLYMSPNVEEVCGFSAEELMRDGLQFWMPRIHEDDQPGFRKAFMNMLVHHRTSDFQYRFLTRDNRWIWLHERVVPVSSNDNGSELAACGVYWDVTEQVKAAEHSRQSEKLQVLGQLAGGVAHDFNNQISAIIGLTDLLSHEVAQDPHLKHLVDEIAVCADHAAALPQQLLTFSRKSAGKLIPQNVHQVIEQTAALLSRSIAKNIHLRTDLAARNPAISADSSQLQNALLNLCLNARDAMPRGGELIISTENRLVTTEDTKRLSLMPGEYFCLSVKDTGEGMSEETQKHIFEPFFTTKPVGKGTGMGLSTVFGSVKDLGGEIEVISAPGKGANITLILPIGSQIDDAPVVPQKSVKKILLVDDENGVLSIVASMLQDMGLRVVSCHNGEQAVAEYEKQSAEFSMVILDMVMPEFDGAKTFNALHQLNSRLPVLLVSARATDDEIKSVLNQGASDYLPKPFGYRELKEKIESVMTNGLQ
jgi:PAS domain S-box-containing protein